MRVPATDEHASDAQASTLGYKHLSSNDKIVSISWSREVGGSATIDTATGYFKLNRKRSLPGTVTFPEPPQTPGSPEHSLKAKSSSPPVLDTETAKTRNSFALKDFWIALGALFSSVFFITLVEGTLETAQTVWFVILGALFLIGLLVLSLKRKRGSDTRQG